MADETPDFLLRTDDLRGVRFQLRVTQGMLGERKVHGMLRLEPDALVLEYEQQANFLDQFMRLMDGPSGSGRVKLVRIPLLDVESLTVQTSFWSGASVELRTVRLQSLEGVPGAKAGVLKLPVEKPALPDAKALVSRALALQSEQRMRKSGLL